MFIDKLKKIENPVIDIVICNFNTTTITNNCIRSIIKNVKSFKYKICIYDTSDKYKFILDEDIDKNLVDVIDITFLRVDEYHRIYRGQIIDFSTWCNHYVDIAHSLAIQYILDNIKSDYIILFDSDTIIKKDLDFIDLDYCTISLIEKSLDRFLPFMQFLNIKKLKEYNVLYTDIDKWDKDININKKLISTGYHFTRDIIDKKLSYKEINIYDYIIHYGACSYLNKNRDEDLDETGRFSIQNNLFFIWFGDIKPKYINFCIESFKKLNPHFNIIYLEYDFNKIKNICFKNIITNDYEYFLKYSYDYTYSLNKNLKYSDLLQNYIYVLLNKYGGIYCHLDTICLKKIDTDIMKLLYFNLNHYCKDTVLMFKKIMIGLTKNNVDYYNPNENCLLPIIQVDNLIKKDFYDNCNVEKYSFNEYNYIYHFYLEKETKIKNKYCNNLDTIISYDT